MELWCFQEKNATQRAKYLAEQKLCFAFINGNHNFRQCSRDKNDPKPECDSTHNVLLHEAEKIFRRKENSNVSNKTGTKKTKENTNTSTQTAVNYVHYIESSKGLLPIVTLGVSSNVTSLLTLVLCDSASTRSWLSSSLVSRLGLVGEPVNLSMSGSIQPPSLKLRWSSLQFPPSRVIVISYSLCKHMLKTIFGCR